MTFKVTCPACEYVEVVEVPSPPSREVVSHEQKVKCSRCGEKFDVEFKYQKQPLFR